MTTSIWWDLEEFWRETFAEASRIVDNGGCSGIESEREFEVPAPGLLRGRRDLTQFAIQGGETKWAAFREW